MSGKKIISLIGFFILLVLGGFFYNTRLNKLKSAKQEIKTPQETGTKQSSAPIIINHSTDTPESLLLKVPFTPQAPTANWDTIHNEDCEEASAIMTNAYFYGPRDSVLNTEYVETELKKLTDWQMKTLGYNLNINSEEIVKMLKSNFALEAEIKETFDENYIKRELAKNRVILMPVNGRLLNNPNYKRPGPKYHMLVLKGYAKTKIITNDPGTKKGLNYPYDFQTLINANGNWDHETQSVNLENKNIIVVWK